MAEMTLEQAFTNAVAHARAGRPTEAENLCRQIVAIQPGFAPAWHFLGTLQLSAGHGSGAEELIRRAIALDDSSGIYSDDLGVALGMQGQIDAAIDSFLRAAVLDPSAPRPHFNLGFAYEKAKRWDLAIDAYRRAMALRPDYPQAMNNLANALRHAGRLSEAIDAANQAIGLHPESADAHLTLGNILSRSGQLEEAEAAIRKAISLEPQSPDALNNLGNVLHQRNRSAESIEAYERAISLRPGFIGAMVNLGNVYQETGAFESAIAVLQKAIYLAPGNPLPLNSLGGTLGAQGRLEEAVVAFTKALSIAPGYAQARLNLAHAYLAGGDFERGWPLYETRCALSPNEAKSRLSLPRWNGEPLDGRRILLTVEQGLGDTIHFVRYAPLVAQRGGRVVMQVPEALKGLLLGQRGIATVIGMEEPLPDIDLQAPLMSLPGDFQTRLETIPATIPYLKVDADKSGRWRDRLESFPGLKVGLVWAGSPGFYNDRRRSLPLSSLSRLAHCGVSPFFGLQKGPAASQLSNPPVGMELIDWTGELHDFADTAALIANLDLVIACDTAVAHLAGAIGARTWVLLPFAPDWRWLRGRSDSPWYPTMRLFRQPRPGDWDSVILECASELARLVGR